MALATPDLVESPMISEKQKKLHPPGRRYGPAPPSPPACCRRASRRPWRFPRTAGMATLKDVEHVVILMQENRLLLTTISAPSGVRGFGDRMAIPLPDGQRVWHQKGSKGEILPYHFDTSTTS